MSKLIDKNSDVAVVAGYDKLYREFVVIYKDKDCGCDSRYDNMGMTPEQVEAVRKLMHVSFNVYPDGRVEIRQ